MSILGDIGRLAFTWIGYYFGGPFGAFIGSLVGAAVFPVEGGSSTGPRSDDLQITSSTAGKRIPYIAGRYPCDGNVIWGREITEVATTRRVGKSLFSSGTKVTEYSYFGTFAVGLCEGPIEGISRIWAYGKLIYDVRPLAERQAEFLARAEWVRPFEGINVPGLGDLLEDFEAQLSVNLNADLEEVMTVYLGTDDQLPDPVIEEFEGADSSDGGVPAFRGLAYVLFEDLPLDQFGYGARIPQLRFEICRALPEVGSGDSDDDDNVGDDVLAA